MFYLFGAMDQVPVSVIFVLCAFGGVALVALLTNRRLWRKFRIGMFLLAIASMFMVTCLSIDGVKSLQKLRKENQERRDGSNRPRR